MLPLAALLCSLLALAASDHLHPEKCTGEQFQRVTNDPQACATTMKQIFPRGKNATRSCHVKMGTCGGWLSPTECPTTFKPGNCPKIIAINTYCLPCGAAIPLTNCTNGGTNCTNPLGPQETCPGGESFPTVYGQRCTTTKGTNSSSCMVGSEGFSWCSTTHLWWRDDHWFDWDLCGLCSTDHHLLVTANGLDCTGPCHNRHNNHETLAPRCEVDKEKDPAGIGMDYCTTCEGDGCPDATSAPRDKRPGSQVGHIVWNDNSGNETKPEDPADPQSRKGAAGDNEVKEEGPKCQRVWSGGVWAVKCG